MQTCLDKPPPITQTNAQTQSPGKASQVQPSLSSGAIESETSASIWVSDLNRGKGRPEEAAIPQYDASGGELHALVPKQSLHTCVDHIGMISRRKKP